MTEANHNVYLRITSGGQTGPDRAALDVALERFLPCGGWVPKGRRTEDGPLHPKYPLVEMATESYRDRTIANVRDADAVLVLVATSDDVYGGTGLTISECRRQRKPARIAVLGDLEGWPELLAATVNWLVWHVERTGTLMVAGSRESKSPGIYLLARDFLRRLLDGYEVAVYGQEAKKS